MAKLFPQPLNAQLKGFLPSWSPRMWLSKLKRQLNSRSQPSLGHDSFLLCPEWTRSSCWCRNQELLNSFLHSLHGTLTTRTSNLNETQHLMCSKVCNATTHHPALQSHLYVLSCALDIPSTSFPEKDMLRSHKGNLQESDRGGFFG